MPFPCDPNAVLHFETPTRLTFMDLIHFGDFETGLGKANKHHLKLFAYSGFYFSLLLFIVLLCFSVINRMLISISSVILLIGCFETKTNTVIK